MRRAYTRITRDIFPGVVNKLWRKQPQPQGQQLALSRDWCMTVPFQYEVHPSSQRVAIVCHIFHADLAAPMISALAAAKLKGDLFISTNTEEKAREIRAAAARWTAGEVTVRIIENRGRDIAPKLVTFSDIYSRYSLVLFLHSKRSDHYPFGDGWRDHLMACLVGSPEIVKSIEEIFALQPGVGMVIPAHYHELRNWVDGFHWGANFRRSRRLAWKMDIDIGEHGVVDFPSGSMFWARPAALRPLLDLKLDFADFSREPCQTDGTLAHCIERLFLFSCEKAGFRWVKVIAEDVATPQQKRVSIVEPAEIGKFTARHSFDLLSAQAN
jgi:lipopolysaccharide biosynthesis protein